MTENLPAVSLTRDEAADLIAAERRIQAGADAVSVVMEAGLALAEVRDRRLYRAAHQSFDDYLVQRWGFRRGYADRMIAAAEVVQILAPKNPRPGGAGLAPAPLPTSEKVARPLAKLRDEPAKARKAWKAAVKDSGGQPTADQVRAAVEDQLPVKKAPAPRAPEQMSLPFEDVTALEDDVAARIARASAAELVDLKRTVRRWAEAINAKTPARPKAQPARPASVTPILKTKAK